MEGRCTPDDDLDQLLNDALSDFDKVAESTPQVSAETNTANDDTMSTATPCSVSVHLSAEDKQLKERVGVTSSNTDQKGTNTTAASQATSSLPDMDKLLGMDNIPGLANLMMSALGGHEEAIQEIENLARHSDTHHPPPPASGDLDSALQEAVRSLAENADDLNTGAESVDDELARVIQEFGELGMPIGLGDQGGGLAGMEPVMNNMMGMLLSRDIFYPGIKEMSERYPTWLDKNSSAISSKELERYKKQLMLMQEICAAYEDTSLSQQTCTKRVTEAMERMQTLGFPPSEISSNLPGTDMSSNQRECNVM